MLSSAVDNGRLYRLIASLALVSVSLLFVALYRLFFHPLSAIPGPLLARVTGLWRSWRYFRMSWHDDILALHDHYGPVVRIAPNEISIVDSPTAKKFYGHGHNALKTAWYDTWGASVPGIPILFSETDGKLHAALRRRVSAAYSMSAILKYEKHIQRCLDLCQRKLYSYARKGESVDMAEWTHALAFDIVGELAFGHALGHLDTESDVDGLRAANTADVFWTGNLGHFWLQARLLQNPVVEFLRSTFSQPSPAVRFQIWAEERIRRRKRGLDGADRDDMLSHFLQMKPLPGKESLEDFEVLVEAINIM